MYCVRVHKNFEDLDTVDVQDCDPSNCLNCEYFHAKGDARYVPYKEVLGF